MGGLVFVWNWYFVIVKVWVMQCKEYFIMVLSDTVNLACF